MLPTKLSHSLILTLYIVPIVCQLVPLSVNAPITQYTQSIGGTVNLRCVVTGTASSVVWLKGKDILDHNNKLKYANGNLNNPSLTVRNIQLSDEGGYVCRAYGASNTIVNTDTMTITPQATPPNVWIGQSSYSKLSGQQVTLGCTVSSPSSPLQSVQWVFTNQRGTVTDPVVISTQSPVKYKGSSNKNPSITIYNLTSSDQGTYRCRARNLMGATTSNSTLLIVTGNSPILQIPQKSYTPVYGSPLTIQCIIVSAVPPVTEIYWQRNHSNQITTIYNGDKGYRGSTVSTPSLTINSVNTNNSGIYKCFARNAAGIGSSNGTDVTITGGLLSVKVKPSSLAVIQGTTTVLQCIIIGQPRVTRLSWTKVSNNVLTILNATNSKGKYLGGTLSNPTLIITNFQSTDAGTYICEATNRAGTQASEGSVLTHIGLLTVTLKPKYIAFFGRQIVMDCTVTGTPRADNIYWQRKQTDNSYSNINIRGNSRYSGGNLNNHDLVMTNVEISDKGTYRCLATNAAGTAYSNDTYLDVSGNKPKVTIGAPNYSVNYGRPVTLDCTIVSYPPHNSVSWLKYNPGKNETKIDLSNTAKYSGSITRTPSLTIQSADLNDGGTYVCTATNIFGTGRSSGTVLNVDGGLLTVTAARPLYNAESGQTVTLGCFWSGNPPPYFITWQKIVNNVTTDINLNDKKYVRATVARPSLTISQVDNQDSVEYICTATNAAGRAYSKPTFLLVTGSIPRVEITNTLYTVNYGSDVTLECRVIARPFHTEVKWTKTYAGSTNDVNFGVSRGKYAGASIFSPSLVINNITLDDEAYYTCTATNKIGTGTSRLTELRVIGGLLTVSIPQQPYDVQIGKSITIPCNVVGNPAAREIRWKKIQKLKVEYIDVQSSKGKYTGSTLNNPSLTINSVIEEDLATYQCVASNAAGMSTSKPVYLNVFGDIPAVRIPSDRYVVNFGGDVTIPCYISANPIHKTVVWKRLFKGNLQDINVPRSNGKYSGSTINSPDLKIYNADLDDETSYMCTAVNDVGIGQSQTRFLDVLGGFLEVSIPSRQFSVEAGQNIQIPCLVSGTPSATSILWKMMPLGGTIDQAIDIDIATSNGHFSGASILNPSMRVNTATMVDKADYICTAVNAAGTSQSKPTRLNVIGTVPKVAILNPPYEVFYGQTVTVLCKVDAIPQANNIVWSKTINRTTTTINTAHSRYYGGIITNPSLTIINTNIKEDEGTYVCTATNSLGTGKSNSVFLDVIGGLLTVKVPEDEYLVQQGNSIQIGCSWSGIPSATSVVWKKYIGETAEDIVIGNGKYGGSTVMTPALSINRADHNDDAIYLCTASNDEGTSNSQPVKLEVTGGVPVVKIEQPRYVVKFGNYVVLACVVTSNPKQTSVQWFKIVNNNYLPINLADVDKYRGSSIDNPSLTITSATHQDEGQYVCSATNSIGTTRSSTTFLDVFGESPTVQISSTNFPVLIGNQITLGCNVIANPQVTKVYWIFEDLSGQKSTITPNSNTVKYGGMTAQSPSLILNKAVYSDEGRYTCYATNDVGTGNSKTATLTITGQTPLVSVTLPIYSVDFGQQITLGCNVRSNPPHFRVFWRRVQNGTSDVINVANSNGKYGGSAMNFPSLAINNVVLSDQASYICNAENSIGTGSSSATILKLIGNIPRVYIQQQNYKVDYGDTLRLVCTVSANPFHTQVYWQKIRNGVTSMIDENVIRNEARLSGSTVGTPTLTIRNVNLNDDGIYVCFARNRFGTGQSSPTTVSVRGAIPTVQVLSNSYSVVYSGVVTLQCVVTAYPAVKQVLWQRRINGQLKNVTGITGDRLSGSTVTFPSLMISKASFQDEGVYVCTATNDAGTGTSQKTFLDVIGNVPEVALSQSEFQGSYGQSIKLKCSVTSYPTTTRVYWKKLENGKFSEINMAATKVSGSSIGTPSLLITNLNKNDEGLYQCFADNDVGTGSSKQTYLRVIGDIPIVKVSNMYNARFRENAVLNCRISANPAVNDVFWKKYDAQNQLVDINLTLNNNNKYRGSTVGTPSLTILNVIDKDAGRYVCYAANAVGTGSSTITTLNIIGDVPSIFVSDDDSTVSIGNPITLGCSVSATPRESTVYWTKLDRNGTENVISKTNTAKYRGQMVNSPALLITNTDLADTGTYYCYATNSVGTGKSSPVSLNVIGYLPKARVPQPVYSVNFDQTATIPCSITAAPSVRSIQWKKIVRGVEENINMNKSKYSGATTSSPSLIIFRTDSSDEAVYICTATNSVGTGRSQQTYLDVVGDIPYVNVGSNSYTVFRTRDIELECNIKSNPPITSMRWSIVVNGSQTNLRNVAGKYNSPTVSSPNLIIYNADSQDRNYYVCMATNIVGTGRSQTTFLDVTGNIPLTTVSLPTYNGNIGGSVTLGCNINAIPAVNTVYWVKTKSGQDTIIRTPDAKNRFSKENPSLTISDLSENDEGYYVCYASNDIGTGNSQQTFLNVIGSIPEVTIPNPTYSTNIGGTITLQCKITTSPVHTRVFWQRIEDNGDLTTIDIDSKKYLGSSTANPSLTITNVQPSDKHNYICFASNAVGTGQSGQTYLNIIGDLPIVNITSNIYSVQYGDSVEIPCIIKSNPAHAVVYWKRIQNAIETLLDTSYIENNRDKYGGGSLNFPSLIIKQADRQKDQAFYECSAMNSVGTGTSSRTFLRVTGDIPVVEIPENYYAVEITKSLTIPCSIKSNPTHTNVMWKRRNKDGALVSLDVSDQTKYVHGNLGTPALIILSTTHGDEGYYTCTAMNAAGIGTSSLTFLDVTGSILQVTIPQESYNVNYGKTVQLVCKVSGSPEATQVYWKKIRDGVSTTLRQSSINRNKYSDLSLDNPSLTILNVDEEDRAIYRCYARNFLGTGESQQTQLNVIGRKPRVVVGQGYKVHLGKAITLECNVFATPSAIYIQWSKTSNGVPVRLDSKANPTKYSGGNLNVPSVNIYNASFSDEGAYTCHATNAVGTTISPLTYLKVVGDSPIVTVDRGQYSVVIGNSVTLACSARANPPSRRILWKTIRNGIATDLQPNSRYSGATIGNPSLHIENVQQSDEGIYVCYAENRVGTGKSSQVYLNTEGDVPTVNIESSSYWTVIGNSVTLVCSVDAFPTHTSVQWQTLDKDNNTVDVDMGNPRYAGSMVNSSSLVISNVMRNDQGRYLCLATNAVGTSQSQPIYLNVVGGIPSVIVPKPTYYVNSKYNVTLLCSYTAYPPAAEVRWKKNNQIIREVSTRSKYGGSMIKSPSLVIYDAEESDEGNYMCEVTNSVGTGISTVTYVNVLGIIPNVTANENAYTVNLNDDITLDCSVNSDPQHTLVYWQMVDGGTPKTIAMNGFKYKGSSVGTPSLIIQNAAFSDSGTYYCYAMNSAGTGVSGPIVLGVTGNKPSVSLLRNVTTVTYGDNVILECEVVANPSINTVYWQKITAGSDNVTVDMTNTNKYEGATVHSPSLKIKNVDFSDSGNYICLAANSVGKGQSLRGELEVIGGHPTVLVGQPVYSVNIGEDISMTCEVTSIPHHSTLYWTRMSINSPVVTISATSTKYSINSNIDFPTLTVNNVMKSDEGQYTCHATNVVGTGQSQPVKLSVVGNIPVLKASIPVTDFQMGENVVIACKIVADPVITKVTWKTISPFTNEGVTIDTSSLKYSGGTVTVPNLTINSVTNSDEGSYYCQAENTEGIGTSNIVYLQPTGDRPFSVAITPDPIIVEAGNQFMMTCTATGNPPPIFQWFKTNNMNYVIGNTPVLAVQNAQAYDKGSYTCRASNEFGSSDAHVNVDVQYKPKVLIDDLVVSAKKGMNVEIRCSQISNPFAHTVTWSKILPNGQQSTVGIDNKKYFGGTVGNPTLTIANVNENDVASYKCSATNIMGTGSSELAHLTFDVANNPADTKIYPESMSVIEGSPFSMFCNSTGTPKYQWYFNGEMIQKGQSLSISVSEFIVHDGIFTCKAYNKAGSQQAYIDVDVKYPPISNVQRKVFKTVLGRPVTLQCLTQANPEVVKWEWFYNNSRLMVVDRQDYIVYMDDASDAGVYSCIAFNEVGQSSNIEFNVLLEEFGLYHGLTEGEIAAICLGFLFFLLLFIAALICCLLQGCCVWPCCAALIERFERFHVKRVAPYKVLDVPKFYEMPAVIREEEAVVSGVYSSLQMAPLRRFVFPSIKRDLVDIKSMDDNEQAGGNIRQSGDYDIVKYMVLTPGISIDGKTLVNNDYVTTTVHQSHLPAIKYTYDEEERRRRIWRRNKKMKNQRHYVYIKEDENTFSGENVEDGAIYSTYNIIYDGDVTKHNVSITTE